MSKERHILTLDAEDIAYVKNDYEWGGDIPVSDEELDRVAEQLTRMLEDNSMDWYWQAIEHALKN